MGIAGQRDTGGILHNEERGIQDYLAAGDVCENDMVMWCSQDKSACSIRRDKTMVT